VSAKRGKLLIIVILAAGLGYLGYSTRQSEANPASVGMVQRIRLRVAPEVSGRLAQILVKPGQVVQAGDVLAIIDIPELAASLGEARAAAISAAAERDRTLSGVRAEEVNIAASAIETVQANLLLAQQGYDRAVALARRGFASQQRLDEATAQLDKYRAELDSRKAQYAAASAGPTAEERVLAVAKTRVAEATMRDVEARLAKTRIVAPYGGMVATIAAEPGEILPVGRPILTLDLDDQLFFAFSIREDRLQGVNVGARRDLLDAQGRNIPALVTEMRPLGEFATWRAARAVGDHDLSSFRVRLEPLTPTSGLQAGMTVWLSKQR
jgi:HlyD family secretion protein